MTWADAINKICQFQYLDPDPEHYDAVSQRVAKRAIVAAELLQKIGAVPPRSVVPGQGGEVVLVWPEGEIDFDLGSDTFFHVRELRP